MSGLLSRTLWLAVLSTAAAAHFVAAQEPAPESPSRPAITLRNAIERSLAGNPDLRGFEHRLRAHDGRALSAGLRPPLELRTEIENVAGTGPVSGVDGAETTLSLAHVIELGGKRELRRAAAGAGREVLEIEREAAQLDVIAEVARRFIHVAADQEQLSLTRRASELARATVEAARRRVSSAKAPEVELNRARIALERSLIEQEHAEHELSASRRKLAAMWGATEADFGLVAADLHRLPAVSDYESLASRVSDAPDFLRFASEARLRDAELRVAEARRRADIAVTAGVRHLQATGDQALVLGFSLPLFTGSRSQGGIDEARALRALTDAQREAHRVRVLAQLYEIHQELQHAVNESTVLRETVLPDMEAALKATEYAFERGRYGYLEWVDAQRELIAVHRAIIEASTNAHLFQTEIERLTAAPVSVTP